MPLWGEERVPDMGQHAVAGVAVVLGTLLPLLNPEAFQSLSVPQTWGPELHRGDLS